MLGAAVTDAMAQLRAGLAIGLKACPELQKASMTCEFWDFLPKKLSRLEQTLGFFVAMAGLSQSYLAIFCKPTKMF